MDGSAEEVDLMNGTCRRQLFEIRKFCFEVHSENAGQFNFFVA
jgi:hypothetical protein